MLIIVVLHTRTHTKVHHNRKGERRELLALHPNRYPLVYTATAEWHERQIIWIREGEAVMCMLSLDGCDLRVVPWGLLGLKQQQPRERGQIVSMPCAWPTRQLPRLSRSTNHTICSLLFQYRELSQDASGRLGTIRKLDDYLVRPDTLTV